MWARMVWRWNLAVVWIAGKLMVGPGPATHVSNQHYDRSAEGPDYCRYGPWAKTGDASPPNRIDAVADDEEKRRAMALAGWYRAGGMVGEWYRADTEPDTEPKGAV